MSEELTTKIAGMLHEAGWRSPNDAQWTGLRALLPDLAVELSALRPAAQPVAKIERNMSGQIRICTPSGDAFDMSQHVGVTFYAAPPAAPAPELPRTDGEWQVYIEPTPTKEDAKRELCALVDGTPSFAGHLVMITTPQGLAPAVTGCGADSLKNAHAICAAMNGTPASPAPREPAAVPEAEQEHLYDESHRQYARGWNACRDAMLKMLREPTPEMDMAGTKALSDAGVDEVYVTHNGEPGDAIKCYRAMIETALRGCQGMLREASKQLRLNGDTGHAAMCERFAAAAPSAPAVPVGDGPDANDAWILAQREALTEALDYLGQAYEADDHEEAVELIGSARQSILSVMPAAPAATKEG